MSFFLCLRLCDCVIEFLFMWSREWGMAKNHGYGGVLGECGIFPPPAGHQLLLPAADVECMCKDTQSFSVFEIVGETF